MPASRSTGRPSTASSNSFAEPDAPAGRAQGATFRNLADSDDRSIAFSSFRLSNAERLAAASNDEAATTRLFPKRPYSTFWHTVFRAASFSAENLPGFRQRSNAAFHGGAVLARSRRDRRAHATCRADPIPK